MLKQIKELDKKFSWSFFGFLVGVIGLLLAIYTVNKKDKPFLNFEVLTNTEVINVNEDIGKLKILYDDKNLMSNDTTLYLLTIKLTNSGNSSINILNFDIGYPVGIEMVNSKIVSPPNIIEYSNDYLKERYSFVYSNSKITSKPIIFDVDDYLIFKVLLLGKREESIIISSFGKIAGQTEIPVYYKEGGESKPTTIKEILEVVFALVLFILSLVFFLIIISSFTEFVSSMMKKRKIRIFKAKCSIQIDSHYSCIFELYNEDGFEVLKHIISLYENELKFEKFESTSRSIDGLDYRDFKFLGIEIDSSTKLQQKYTDNSYFNKFKDNNEFIYQNKDKKIVNKDFANKVIRFIDFIGK